MSLFRDNDLQNLEQSYDFTKTVIEHNLYAYDIMISFFLLVDTIKMNTEHKICQDEIHTMYLTFYENIDIKIMSHTYINSTPRLGDCIINVCGKKCKLQTAAHQKILL
jgi:hypothetical protein